MKSSWTYAVLGLGVVVLSTTLAAEPPVALAGHWRLNRDQSSVPEEISFTVDTAAAGESAEAAREINELITSARTPTPVLTIGQTESAVTITDAFGHALTFHPNGREEIQHLDNGPIGATSTWADGRLVIQLTVETNRLFRYTYSRTASGQLMVETRLEDGHADKVIRSVYDAD